MENENTPVENENILSENVTLPAEEIIAPEYDSIVSDIARLLELARRQAARSVNALMTATYWLIGRRIVEFEREARNALAMATNLLNGWLLTSPQSSGADSAGPI